MVKNANERDMAAAFTRPPSGLQFVGMDFSSGPDSTALALATRKGTHVVLITGGNPSVDRDWINSLNAGRKADREILAMALTMLAENRGAQVEQRDEPATTGHKGCIALRIELEGVGAMIDVDNLLGDYSLISWFNRVRPSRNFSSRFARLIGEAPGGLPHHKATSHPENWYSLAMMLDAGLCLAARGEAFEPAIA